MNRFLLPLFTIVVLSLVLYSCNQGVSTDDEMTRNDNTVLVSTHTVITRDLPIWLKTVGQVHSQTAPTLAAEVSGRVTRVTADTGDEIVEGQLLAEIDTSTLLLKQQAAQANIERLEVHIANGEIRVARFEKLSAQNLSSQGEFDDAREQLEAFRADLKAAIAQLAIVKDSLARSRIVAPVSGVIQNRFIAEGDFVNRGQDLFDVTQPDLLEAWLPFPETVALKIKVGQPAKIYSPLTPGEFAPGNITQLQPSIGLGSRAVHAIIDLNDPGNLRPEATLSGEVLIETRENVVMVPALSIVRRPLGDVVYIIQGDRAEAREVVTGHREGSLVEITSGLNGGEIIATDGAAFLTDGASVKVAQ